MKKIRLLLVFALFSFLFMFFTGYGINEDFYLKEANSSKVNERIMVYPSGESCGIKIRSEGILVISVTDIDNVPSPAKKANIIPGDFIKRVNGITLKNSKHFISIVKELKSNEFEIEYERDSQIKKTKIKAILYNGEYVLGMWVRDSIAGLGTLTYYSGDKEKFAALGHSISDVDTGEIFKVKNGELVYSKIVSSKKGEAGNPGGLTGIFSDSSEEIGRILKNSEFGLYGDIKDRSIVDGKPLIPIGYKNDIQLGKAEIISTIENDTPRTFEIEIIKINNQDKPDIKGMVIKVTDKELLEKTGGIIQGMSGSPIIQDGKLVGAVTHVFVNDPTRGYGIFIENMLIN